MTQAKRRVLPPHLYPYALKTPPTVTIPQREWQALQDRAAFLERQVALLQAQLREGA